MDSSSPCGHWSGALVPGRRGRVFIPALLTAGAASLIYCFSTSPPALVAGSVAPVRARITWCRAETYGRNLGSPTRSAWPVMR